jgi:cytochrome c oxidase cbb3-type subunit 3
VRAWAALAATVWAAAAGCEREQRRTTVPAAGRSRGSVVRVGDLQPGRPLPDLRLAPFSERNAFEMSEGQRLFTWYNCAGCHANGGGGMGPPLMDDGWIYGSEPENVFRTIVEGRPNGMPSFGGHIPEHQVWQLVAYVRALGGLVPKTAAPGRPDNMAVKEPENAREAGRPTPEPAENPR